MTSADPTEARKRLRVGHVSERSAVNAVRTILERHGLVVVEVDGRSDYGRDLIVDITQGGEITGAVIGVQVKGDRRFIKAGSWELPVTEKDLRFWAESSMPVVGVLWDPDSEELRWANLTAFARTDPAISSWPPGRSKAELLSERTVLFPTDRLLDDNTLADVIEYMYVYVQQTAAPTLLGLFESDDERRCRAVFDCWALGRTDARAFLLLRRALPGLQGESLRRAIVTLSHLTPHPDIFWHAGNWIPPEVERKVRPAFRWSAQEVCDLVRAVEEFEEGGGWHRGGLGQCLWSLLVVDPGLASVVSMAIDIAVEMNHVEAAFRLLVIHQYLAEDPLAVTRSALERHSLLRGHEYSQYLVEELAASGRVDVY